ncbi:hypothetical protein B0H99_102287 [Planomicrobium soli]|uniref:Uncharacterized protein n=1 Tax=Planomicrobium soli TaxID=1176648 RepID=A0A2P8H5X1_9BACL|nr:hypothetical protein B0H99_102287 [Planomicrobium soli]
MGVNFSKRKHLAGQGVKSIHLRHSINAIIAIFDHNQRQFLVLELFRGCPDVIEYTADYLLTDSLIWNSAIRDFP